MTILSFNVVFASETNDTSNDINTQTNENEKKLQETSHDTLNENNFKDSSKLNTEKNTLNSSTSGAKTENAEITVSNSNNTSKKELGTTKLTTQNSNTNSNAQTLNGQTSINKEETKILVKTYSVVKERNLIIQLVNANGEAIKNQIISLNIANKNYNKQTDDNGMIYLKISKNTGKYAVKVKYNGDDTHMASENSFTMTVYKVKTSFTVPSKYVIRGKYFIAYLKDKYGNPLNNALVKITYKNKNINKRTNANGRITLKIRDKVGKYKLKLRYGGGKSYLKTSKQLTIKAYNSKTKILSESNSVKKGNYLILYLKDNSNRILTNKKLTIKISKKNYKKTTNKKGKVYLKLNYAVGTYKIKVNFKGSMGYLKTSKTLKIKVIPNYSAKIHAKSKTLALNNASTVKYSIRLTNLKGKPLSGKTLTIKTKCNNFTSGTGRKITKKTIILSSDNIYTKATDKKLLNNMAKLLRAKGYKVIVSGIGPNYHVSDVKKYSNACVFSLVGGIDSGMFVDMASSYYQYYLKKNNNQFVLGCVRSPSGVNLANRVWLKRAHDDNYSKKSFKGLYFPGAYLNKKTKVDYVYGGTAKLLVNNFLKYAKKGKSIGMGNTKPGLYKTYKVTTNANGYASINLHIGAHTVISSFVNKESKAVPVKTYVVVKK